MNEIADRARDTCELTRELDAERVAQSREKIIRYIDKLASAGQNDPHQLMVYARVPEGIARGTGPAVRRLLITPISAKHR
jgi:hypothetical protein